VSALLNGLRAASSGNPSLGTFAFFHFAKPQIGSQIHPELKLIFSSTSFTNSTNPPSITICLSCMPLFASHHHGTVHNNHLPPDVCHINILVRSEKESQESKKNKES
jgi:hypothetical protein